LKLAAYLSALEDQVLWSISEGEEQAGPGSGARTYESFELDINEGIVIERDVEESEGMLESSSARDITSLHWRHSMMCYP